MSDIVDAIVSHLGLAPHPEGGWYAETWRDTHADGGRGAGTAIYYLLAAGQRSHWHRVDATEVWHFYAGGPLRLSIASASGDGPTREVTLGRDLAVRQVPQAVVPAGAWQAAEPLGDWTLCGCTVSPAFTFDGFELAPPDWEPPGYSPPKSGASPNVGGGGGVIREPSRQRARRSRPPRR